MRILVLTTSDLDSPAGGGRYFPLAKALAARGNQVFYAGLHPDFDHLSTREFNQSGVEVHFAGPMHIRRVNNEKEYYSIPILLWIVLKSTILLTIKALKIHPEVILVGKPHPMNSIAGLLGKLVHRSKLVVDFDDFEAASSRLSSSFEKSVLAFFENHMGPLADFVTTNTFFTKDRLCSLGVNPEKICYLSNGIELERFEDINKASVEDLQRSLDLNDRPVIAFIGSLSIPNHPVYLLLEAFKLTHQALPGSVLLLVGGGNYFTRLKNEAAALGIEADVRFLGRVPHDKIGLYYRLADVSVDPVIDDDAARGRQPIKLFESWAAGVPFITGDTGDRCLLAGEPKAIMMCKPGDPVALSDAITYLLTHPAERDQLVQIGKERVRGFTFSKIAEKFSQGTGIQSRYSG